jgi:hypothetical protein
MAIGNSTLQERLLLALVILPFVLALSALPSTARSQDQAPQAPTSHKIATELQAEMDTLAPGEMVTAIVTMRDQVDLAQPSGVEQAARQEGDVRRLEAQAEASQQQIRPFLRAGRQKER